MVGGVPLVFEALLAYAAAEKKQNKAKHGGQIQASWKVFSVHILTPCGFGQVEICGFGQGEVCGFGQGGVMPLAQVRRPS